MRRRTVAFPPRKVPRGCFTVERLADARTGLDGKTHHGAAAHIVVNIHFPKRNSQRGSTKSVDALRPYLAQIWVCILTLAGESLDVDAESGKLRVVVGKK